MLLNYRLIIVSAVSVMFWAVIILACTGCGSTSGWRVSFGVSPVAAINEQQTTLDKRK